MLRGLGHEPRISGVDPWGIPWGGVDEGGVQIGTPDLWSLGVPVAARYHAKAPRPPRGKSVNRGRKQEMFDD